MTTEANKNVAVTFLKVASNGAVHEAYSKYVGKDFKHHNPFFEGSANSLAAGMEENARQNPHKTIEIKWVVAEGNFVVIHSHVRLKPDTPGAAVVHIFRFEHGFISELWDVGQPILEASVNQYGMF